MPQVVWSTEVGPLCRASEVLSTIMTAVINSAGLDVECSSCEEMQRAVLNAIIAMEEEVMDDPCVFLMEVEAFYPALD